MLAVKTSDLTKKYGKYYGIDNVNLAVEVGETFGIVGPEGAGKTTLLRLLMNYIFPTVGSGNILGNDIVKDAALIKETTAYVPEEVTCYPQMKAGKYLKMTLKMHGLKNSSRLAELMEKFDIPKKETFEVMERNDTKATGIVAALAIEPKILLLDNVTLGLFSDTKKILFSLLEAEKAKGTTIIMTADSLPQLGNLCDRVALLEDGSIQEIIDFNAPATKAVEPFDDEYEEYQDEQEEDNSYLEDTISLSELNLGEKATPQPQDSIVSAENQEGAADATGDLSTEGISKNISSKMQTAVKKDDFPAVSLKVKDFRREVFENLGMAVMAEEKGKVTLAYAGNPQKLAAELKALGLSGFTTKDSKIALAFDLKLPQKPVVPSLDVPQATPADTATATKTAEEPQGGEGQ